MGEVEAAALAAERWGLGRGPLGGMLAGWVMRYDVAGAGPWDLHHVDPTSPAPAGSHGRAVCGQEMPAAQLWWRVPDTALETALSAAADAGVPWRACGECLAGLEAAGRAEEGGG